MIFQNVIFPWHVATLNKRWKGDLFEKTFWKKISIIFQIYYKQLTLSWSVTTVTLSILTCISARAVARACCTAISLCARSSITARERFIWPSISTALTACKVNKNAVILTKPFRNQNQHKNVYGCLIIHDEQDIYCIIQQNVLTRLCPTSHPASSVVACLREWCNFFGSS